MDANNTMFDLASNKEALYLKVSNQFSKYFEVQKRACATIDGFSRSASVARGRTARGR